MYVFQVMGGLLIFPKVLWVMRNGYMVFIGVQVLRVGIYGYACIYMNEQSTRTSN